MDAQRELLCCMFTFDVPTTTHVCYETIFGRDLAPHTIQHLQRLSMSNSQMKIILESHNQCRYIRPVVQDYLMRLCALKQSLKRAQHDGYAVRVASSPQFSWTSALEEKDAFHVDHSYSNPTISFQLVQTLFTFAVAGNANDAPRMLWDALSIDEKNFNDIVTEVKSRLLTAAGILQYIIKDILPQWKARPGADSAGGGGNAAAAAATAAGPTPGRPRSTTARTTTTSTATRVSIPLECCPKFLEALSFMFEAQAYQVNVALTARNSTKKEVLARICLGITKRYQQALAALNTTDPNGLLLIDRVRPSLRMYVSFLPSFLLCSSSS